MEHTNVFILVNESPTKEFKSSRSLRLGDPITLFLFLIIVDKLAGMMRQTTKKNLYQSVRVGNKDFAVGLLQFVDDNL